MLERSVADEVAEVADVANVEPLVSDKLVAVVAMGSGVPMTTVVLGRMH